MADEFRLRMVLLLASGPLGVKHLQEITGLPQVRVSKHLAYLKARGLVEVERRQNWMLYRLPDPLPTELSSCLDWLRSCLKESETMKADSAARASLAAEADRVARLPLAKSKAPRSQPAPSTPKARATVTSPVAPSSSVAWLGAGDSEYVD